MFQPGDLFWLEAHAEQLHRHPHVLVRVEGEKFVVCALTSNLHRAKEPGNVLLDEGEGGLTKRSVVLVSHSSTIALAQVGARIGALSQERVEQVRAGIRFIETAFLNRSR